MFLSLTLAAVAGFRGGGSEVVRSHSDRSSHVCPGRRLGPPASEHEVEHQHCTAQHCTALGLVKIYHYFNIQINCRTSELIVSHQAELIAKLQS